MWESCKLESGRVRNLGNLTVLSRLLTSTLYPFSDSLLMNGQYFIEPFLYWWRLRWFPLFLSFFLPLPPVLKLTTLKYWHLFFCWNGFHINFFLCLIWEDPTNSDIKPVPVLVRQRVLVIVIHIPMASQEFWIPQFLWTHNVSL